MLNSLSSCLWTHSATVIIDKWEKAQSVQLALTVGGMEFPALGCLAHQ